MSFPEKIPFFVLILCLSWLNNLLIPFAIYFRKFGRHGYKGAGGCNIWGVLMDGVLAGAINLVALNFLLEVQPPVRGRDVLTAFIAGLAVMILMHAWLTWRKEGVWIMPEPGKWNSGGYWHMVSATLQMGFLVFVLWLIASRPFLWALTLTRLTLLTESLFGLLFLLCSSLGGRGLRVGRFHLDNRPW